MWLAFFVEVSIVEWLEPSGVASKVLFSVFISDVLSEAICSTATDVIVH